MNIFSSSYRDSLVEDARAILEGSTPEQRKQFLRDRIQSLHDRSAKNKEKMQDSSLDSEEKSRLKFQNDAMAKEMAWLNSKLNVPSVNEDNKTQIANVVSAVVSLPLNQLTYALSELYFRIRAAAGKINSRSNASHYIEVARHVDQAAKQSKEIALGVAPQSNRAIKEIGNDFALLDAAGLRSALSELAAALKNQSNKETGTHTIVMSTSKHLAQAADSAWWID